MKGRSPERCRGAPGFSTSMIWTQDVCLDEVAEHGHAFKWNRPRCECGGSRVWGHGRVERYFPGFDLPLYVQRFRCADCSTVFTCRPASVWPRFLSFLLVVLDALILRFSERCWPVGVPRQRGGHWLRRMSEEFLARGFQGDPLLWLLECRCGGRWPFSISV
jgi:hypothetical protein